MDISSLAGASDVFGLTGSAAVVAWVVIQVVKLAREWLLAREGKQVEQRAVRVDDETKVIKLNGTKCDGHNALSAEIVSIKDDVKEVSHKLDRYAEQIFDRLRVVEKDVAVLQA
jgi:hypothetical protein